jgi:hypothetical protein
MLLTLWFLWKRILWWATPLPKTLMARDRVLADRAALVFDKHLRAIPPPEIPGYGHSYSLDPYRTTGPKVIGRTPAIEAQVLTAIDRVKMILARHSVPSHLMTALMRDRDPETIAHSKKVEAEVKAEADAEKVARAARGSIPPPPMPSGPPKTVDLRIKQGPDELEPPRPSSSTGAGGSKGTL